MTTNPQSEDRPLRLINPGFEDGLKGWHTSGHLHGESHSGQAALRHGPGIQETTQWLPPVPVGWYTIGAWVRWHGAVHTAAIAIQTETGQVTRALVPAVPDVWLYVVASVRLNGAPSLLRLESAAGLDAAVDFDDLELRVGWAHLAIRGADISSLKKSEDLGGLYRDAAGVPTDALAILREHGLTHARLRVWLDSPDGYHGLAELLALARRLKAEDLQLLVDFHYSDTWADPGKQPKPAAWQRLDAAGLQDAVYQHTRTVCQALLAQETPPAMMQLGNEITHGMLWPEGRNDQSFDTLAALLQAGCRAVKECSSAIPVMLHLDQGGNNALYRDWFDRIRSYPVPFDVIGLSYYPYWHGSLADLQANLHDLAWRYDQDLLIAETAYAFTADDQDGFPNAVGAQAVPGYPFTPDGQARFLADLMMIVRTVPRGHGLGVLWWDAAWIAVPGNGWDPADPASGNNWENQALFDYTGRPVPALRQLGEP